MDNILTKEIILRFKVFGIYQIVGGLIGLTLTSLAFFQGSQLGTTLFLLILLIILLYAHSIFCGILLLMKKIGGLNHSLANQIFQLLAFSIFGFAFNYFSGIYFLLGFDLTNNFLLIFDFGISSWKVTIGSDEGIVSFSLNLIALCLILFIENQKSQIRKARLQMTIASIGE
jgi:hypothetical protein